MFDLIRRHKFSFFLIIACVTASSLFELAQPLWIRQIIDRAFVGGAWNLLPVYTAFFLTFIILAQGTHFIEMRLIEKLSVNIAGELRIRLWGRLLGARISAAQSKTAGAWTSLFCEDIRCIQDYLVEGIASLASQGVYLAGILILAAILDFRMLAAFAFAPALFLIIIPLKNHYLKSVRNSLESQEKLYSFMEDLIRNRWEIRQFRMETALLEECREKFYGHKRVLMAQARLAALFPLVTESLGWLLAASVLGFGSYQVIHGALSIGTLAAFLEYSRRFFSPVREISERWNRFQSAVAAYHRLREEENRLVPERRSGIPFSGLSEGIQFRNISFAYQPGKYVFENLSLDIKPGEKIALTGPSGIGKSTLLKLMLALYEPERGEILVDGVPLEYWNLRSIRKNASLLLLDEVEKQMKPDAISGFLESVLRNPDLTVLWISHREEIIRALPRRIHLNYGHVMDDVNDSASEIHKNARGH